MNNEDQILNNILCQLDSQIATYDSLATLFDAYYPEYDLKQGDLYCSGTLVSAHHRIENTPIAKIRLSSSFKLLDTCAQKSILKNEIERLLKLEQAIKF